MSYTLLNLHKVTALVAAIVVTLGVQGSMLASFDNLAVDASSTQANAACNAVTTPTTEVHHARG